MAQRETDFPSLAPSDPKQEAASDGINHFPAVVLFVNISVWAWLKRASEQTLPSVAVEARGPSADRAFQTRL